MLFSKLTALGLSVTAILDVALAIPQRNGGGKAQQSDTNEGQTISMVATGATAQATSNAADNVGTNKGDATQCQQNSPALILNCENRQTNAIGNGNPNATAGQVASLGDPANFINFCSGKTVTNGLQNTAGSCNGIVMGDIPAKDKMISSIILNPAPGQDVQAETTFNVVIQQTNLQAGVFTNPQLTYYGAPQQVKNGIVVGHTHITIEDLGNSLTPTTPPDPTAFKFFKGIDDAGNGKGQLTAVVTGGLAAGFYRVCTMTSASNHQPVLMPVAQRGAQDDCTKFTVGQGGNANAGTGNANAGTGTGNANANGKGGAAASVSAIASTTTAANGGAKANGNANAGTANANSKGGAAASSSAIASTTTAANGNAKANGNANANAGANASTSGNGNAKANNGAASVASSTTAANNNANTAAAANTATKAQGTAASSTSSVVSTTKAAAAATKSAVSEASSAASATKSVVAAANSAVAAASSSSAADSTADSGANAVASATSSAPMMEETGRRGGRGGRRRHRFSMREFIV